jgi:uncharacterized protein YjbI with pentapeptide repeats
MADLSGVDLNGANFLGADLNEALLIRANLLGADLRRANLENTIFQDAQRIPEWIIQGLDDEGGFSQERLIETIRDGFKNLHAANLSEANLSEANLSGADLSGADLSGVDLSGADLSGADLRVADLSGAELSGANLREAYLYGAHLERAHLDGAHLERADLRGALLREANLTRAHLRRAHLDGAHLVQTILRQADITGISLYGTARDDWIIDGIKCDYVFWDIEPLFSGKRWELEYRFPKDRDFRPGEFEELYKQLPTFEYYFEHGFTPLDPVIMDQVVQTINERNPNIELKLDSFYSRGQPHAVFTVLHKEAIEETKNQLTTDYERRIAALEGKQEQLMELVSTLINKPQYIGRDYIAISEKAQVNELTTGDSKDETKREE